MGGIRAVIAPLSAGFRKICYIPLHCALPVVGRAGFLLNSRYIPKNIWRRTGVERCGTVRRPWGQVRFCGWRLIPHHGRVGNPSLRGGCALYGVYVVKGSTGVL